MFILKRLFIIIYCGEVWLFLYVDQSYHSLHLEQSFQKKINNFM